MTPSAFLKTLWGEKPPGWVLVWTLPDKNSTWFRDFSHVDRFVAAHTDKDIYTGVSLKDGERFPSRHERCTNLNSAGIPGLWADIDIAGDAHQKQNLPRNSTEALIILREDVGYEPTITINSGHGLQCWWLFAMPWMFADEHERRLAQQLTFNWHGLIADEFAKHGYSVDATHDLARVMRLPGTWNHKLGERKAVEVIQVSDFRWRDIPKLEERKVTAGMPTFAHTEVTPAEIGELNLDPDQPLPGIVEVMLEHMEKFVATWRGQRSDLPSASEYDMSIVGNAIVAGCTNQEIAALIINFHKRRGDDLTKYCERPDYIRRTIARARGQRYE